MAVLQFGDLIHAVHHYQLQVAPLSVYINNTYWRVIQSGTPSGTLDPVLAANGLDFIWKTSWCVCATEDVSAIKTSMQWSHGNGPIIGAAESNLSSQGGTVAQPYLAAQNCIVASIRSSTPGKTGRGRVYVPGLAESQVAGNYVKDVDWATWDTELQLWLSQQVLTSDGVTSFPDGFGLQPARIVLTAEPGLLYRSDVINVIVGKTLRAQRRRQPDHGV